MTTSLTVRLDNELTNILKEYAFSKDLPVSHAIEEILKKNLNILKKPTNGKIKFYINAQGVPEPELDAEGRAYKKKLDDITNLAWKRACNETARKKFNTDAEMIDYRDQVFQEHLRILTPFRKKFHVKGGA